MIVLAHDRKVSLGDLTDATISLFAATLDRRDYHSLLAWEVFGRAVNRWVELGAAARTSAKDWARGSKS